MSAVTTLDHQRKVKRRLAWTFTFLAGMFFDSAVHAVIDGSVSLAVPLAALVPVMIGQARQCHEWLRRHGS